MFFAFLPQSSLVPDSGAIVTNFMLIDMRVTTILLAASFISPTKYGRGS
jgi:hypothetical protein